MRDSVNTRCSVGDIFKRVAMAAIELEGLLRISYGIKAGVPGCDV
jgi:hypothetical protein